MQKERIKLQKALEILFIFLLSLPPLLWLKGNEIIIGHDSGVRLVPLQYIRNTFFSWYPLNNFGVDWTLARGFLITKFPEELFNYIFNSVHTGQIASTIFWFFLMGFSMYICVSGFFSKKEQWLIRLLASTLYMYNFFVLQAWFIFERAKFSLYAALPLGFFILYKTLNRQYRPLPAAFAFSLIFLFFNGGSSPPLYGAVLVVFVTITLYITLLTVLKKGMRSVVHIFGTIGLFLFCTVFVNAHWIVPQLYLALTKYGSRLSTFGGLQGILTWEMSVNKYASLLNLLRLQGIPDWYENLLHPYSTAYISHPLLIAVSFVPIVTILIGLYVQHRRKKQFEDRMLLYTVVLVLMIGMVLTAGSHPPFGFVYQALIRFVPGFAIFRSAFYKFGPAVWFSISFLFAYYAAFLIQQFIQNKILRIIVGVCTLGGLLLYHYPYFGKNIFEWNRPFSTKIEMPGHVSAAFDYIRQNARPDSRILLVPPMDQDFHADSYLWGYWSLDLLPRLALNTPVVANDSVAPGIVEALYESIRTGNEVYFQKLVEIAGIDTILWRGDVLYSDKKTESRDLEIFRTQIENFLSVKRRQTFGLWSVYDIDFDKRPGAIRTVASVATTESNLSLKDGVSTGLLPDSTRSFVSAEKLPPSASVYVSGNIVKAECVLCGADGLQSVENTVLWPYVRFLPDSPFYSFISSKETKVLQAYQTNPAATIDAHISYASKRLAETELLLQRSDKQNLAVLIGQNNAKYLQHMSTAYDQLQKLSGKEGNTYAVKIIAYLRVHHKRIESWDNEAWSYKSFLPIAIFDDIYAFLRATEDQLQSMMWVSTDRLKRYYIEIPDDGVYDLHLTSGTDVIRRVRLDEKEIQATKDVQLTKGTHTIEAEVRPTMQLLADQIGTSSAMIQFDSGTSKRYEIQRFDYAKTYLVRFAYRVAQGKGYAFLLNQNNDKRDREGTIERAFYLSLIDDGKWHTTTQIVHPHFGAARGVVELYYSGVSETSGIVEVSQLSVEEAIVPELFAQRSLLVKNTKSPEITYIRINPIIYTVDITDAHDPFMLRFGEAYDSGWRASLGPLSTSVTLQSLLAVQKNMIPSSNHFPVDGYANAWHVDKTGSYRITLIYWPFIIYIGSISISVGSVIYFFILVLFSTKRRIHE